MTTSRIQKIKKWQQETMDITYQKIQETNNKQMETKQYTGEGAVYKLARTGLDQ